MPHLQFDLSFTPSPEQKTRFASAIVEHFARVVDTGSDHFAYPPLRPRQPRPRLARVAARAVHEPDAAPIADLVEITEELRNRLLSGAGLIPSGHVCNLHVRDER